MEKLQKEDYGLGRDKEGNVDEIGRMLSGSWDKDMDDNDRKERAERLGNVVEKVKVDDREAIKRAESAALARGQKMELEAEK